MVLGMVYIFHTLKNGVIISCYILTRLFLLPAGRPQSNKFLFTSQNAHCRNFGQTNLGVASVEAFSIYAGFVIGVR